MLQELDMILGDGWEAVDDGWTRVADVDGEPYFISVGRVCDQLMYQTFDGEYAANYPGLNTLIFALKARHLPLRIDDLESSDGHF